MIVSCNNCHHKGTPKVVIRGNTVLEVLLWFILIGPIYSLWRSSGYTLECEKCGNPHVIKENVKDMPSIRQRVTLGGWITILVIAIPIIVYSVGNENSSSSNYRAPVTTNSREVEIISITANELFDTYEINELRADDLYKNKRLLVSGTVDNIAKDILDSPYVTLTTGNIIGSVQCMLTNDSADTASQLTKGTPITVNGKNAGKLMNVILRDCFITD
jgi:hypothetical protein